MSPTLQMNLTRRQQEDDLYGLLTLPWKPEGVFRMLGVRGLDVLVNVFSHKKNN